MSGDTKSLAITTSGNSPGFIPEKYVESLTPEQRQGYCEEAFKNRDYVDHPGCWKSVQNAKAVLAAVHAFGEPLNTPRLDALERVFPRLLTEEDRKSGALLLYRYGRGTGLRYLVERLRDRMDPVAAETLAMNQEVQYEALLIKALVERQDPEVVAALGKWKSSAVSRALVEAFKVAIRKQEGDANFPIPLSEQKHQGSIALIQKLDRSLTYEDGPAKYNTRAALIELGAAGHDRMLKEYVSALTDEKSRLSKVHIVRALGAVSQPAATKALIQVVKRFVEKGSTPIWISDGNEHADELAVEAAEALANRGHTASLELISRQLLRFEKDRRSLTDYWERTARAMVRLNGGKPGSPSAKVLENVMGKSWLDTALATQKLKRVPVLWLPAKTWDPEMAQGK